MDRLIKTSLHVKYQDRQGSHHTCTLFSSNPNYRSIFDHPDFSQAMIEFYRRVDMKVYSIIAFEGLETEIYSDHEVLIQEDELT